MSRAATILVLVWAGLMGLLVLTVAATLTPLGPAKPFVNLGAAAAKAGLIAWFYMHLREQTPLMRVIALAVLAWLAIMFALVWADVAQRGPIP